jgi:hypothetical protein
MIYINYEKKAIFIHIPKTGGSYIGPTLVKYYGFKSFLTIINNKRPDHDEICKTNYFYTVKTGNKLYDNSFFNKVIGILEYCKSSEYLNNLMNMDKDKWNSYTKFCFIRNPYDRALSGWRHFNIVFNRNGDFYDYMNQNTSFTSNIEYGHIFMSQITQIQDENGNCGVDIIGKFETLETDFRYILNKIGFDTCIHIPKKENVSNTESSDKIILEKKTIQLLNSLFEDDLNAFHYKKINIL